MSKLKKNALVIVVIGSLIFFTASFVHTFLAVSILLAVLFRQ